MERTIRCLEAEIRNVNRFMSVFFRCSRIVRVSRYGDDPNGGAFGYLWRTDAVNELLTTALDYTVDPNVERFRWFVQWRGSAFCLS